MEHEDKTTVRITVSKAQEAEFLRLLGVPPDDRDDLADARLIDLTFDEWDRPECVNFAFSGIPFTGFHDFGTSYGPHRMCGDGHSCREICADRDERLYMLVDEGSGLPDWQSSDGTREFISFERECLSRMRQPGGGAIA